MRKITQLGLMAAMSFAAFHAEAGFVINQADGHTKEWLATPARDSTNNYAFAWGYDRSDAAITANDSSFLKVYPTITQNSLATDSFSLTGMITSDPTVEILQRIKNNTGSSWDAYSVQIAPDANSVLSNVLPLFPADGGFTTPFTTVSAVPQLDGSVILTFAGGSVVPGATGVIDVQFDVNVVSNLPGHFGYTVFNSVAVATPEPASLSVLLVGAVFAGRRRSRSRALVG